ncbi:DUF262 domain-containing protein [Candidatus Palauibacter sp.]|uniref:DUF262 domain-containing protein n=1 Tax=Candidatus Palauibacter sp. TaxID=3101350 RepID=UPI003D0BECC9
MRPPQITTGDQAFPPRKQYLVPSYQRNYVWTQRDHWEPLWDDVKELAHQVVAAETTTKPHFLGAIITKEIGTVGFINRWWIVDGQQRLTTLQILIAAARAAFTEHGLAQSADILSDLLANATKDMSVDSDKYKIKHKSSDYAGFAAIMDTALSSNFGDTGESRLDDCYAYFLSAVGEWLNACAPDQLKTHAGALTTAILNHLQVVDIRLDDTENSHTIFEALNARGEPLTEWEKTKNYILSVAVAIREDDGDGDRTYQEHLEPYDAEPYWNETVRGTRFSGKRIDVFLFYFAQLELPRLRRKVSGDREIRPLQRGRLYREFRYVGEHRYRRGQTEFLAMLKRLAQYADIYTRIDQQTGFSEYARKVMGRRTVLALGSLVPVLMELVAKLGDGERLDEALRIVDSYLMRRVALKANYSGFDDVAFGLVQVLRDTPADQMCSVLMEQLRASPGRYRWPADDELSLHLLTADMYRGISSGRLRLLLAGIAEHMHGENKLTTSEFALKPSLTVEHIAPQDWERHWHQDLKFGNSEEDKIRLNRLIHRIGNLTLVTEAINPKLGNRPWDHKVKLLEKDSLEMNRRLLADVEGIVWNEEEIDRRSKQLAKYVIAIWPHAEALGRELNIAPLEREDHPVVSGIAPATAERLVDAVTESGIEGHWLNTKGLNRRRRGDRYGRYLKIGREDIWYGAWFGVSADHQGLVLDFGTTTSGGEAIQVISLPDGDFYEMLQSVTERAREIAHAIAPT